MEDHTCNRPKQWISTAYHSQPEEEIDGQNKNKNSQPQKKTTNQKNT
jgi:hypothetical protein